MQWKRSPVAIWITVLVIVFALGTYFRWDQIWPSWFSPVPALEQTYQDKKLGFSFQLPANWVVVPQNQDETYADYLLLSSADEAKAKQDKTFETNPFVAAMDANAVGIELQKNSFPWVKSAQEQDIRNYVSSRSMPGGAQAPVIINKFRKEDVSGGSFYSYSIAFAPEAGININGYILIKHGVMWQIENFNLENPVLPKLLEAVARSVR